MKKFYTLFTALFFALTFNLSAQETVIAVWDFADNSIAGEIHPDFSSAANPDLDYLNGGQSAENAWTNTDVTGGDFDNSYTLSNSSPSASAASNYILNNLNLGPGTATPTAGSGLVNNKIHFSLSFKSITLADINDKIIFYFKDPNSGSGTNHRQMGLMVKQNTGGTAIEVKSLVYNASNNAGTQKLCGNFGATQGLTITDVTVGITLDYDSAGDGSNVASIRFWIDSPDTYASGDGNAWGFKMFNADGFANTTNFPALTATPTAAAATGLANSVIGFLQFTPNLTAAGSEVVFDQIKISTGEYENTVAAGNTPPAPTSALMIQGVLDIDGGNKKAVHVRATEAIADLSIYKLQVYANANTSSSSSYTFSGTASAGDDILIANDGVALESYMSTSTIFDSVDNTGNFPSINGDDSIELLMNDIPVEVYGEIGVDANAADPHEAWEYTNSWAYKVEGAWTYGGVNCTNGSTTTWDSSCVYPLAVGNQPLTDEPRTILTFEDYPVSGDTWYGDAGQISSIVPDPDTSGGDHGNVGRMELAVAGDDWQNSQLNLVADTYAVSLLDGTTKRVTFDMYSTTATCGLLKLEQEINGGATVEHSFNVSGNGWESITVDFTNGASNNGAAVNGEFNKLVFFFNYCADAGNPIGTAPDVRYIDNISYLTGTYNEPPFNPGQAPIPTQLEEDVVSVYSDSYSTNIATVLNPGWGQQTAQSEVELATGDTALLYSNLNYQGLLYTSTDVTTMDYVHLDYYTDDSTALGFFVIQEGTGENGYSIDTELGITTGQWVSVDIPLSHYTVTDLSGANQIKTDGNGTVYLDNIYFWKTPDTTAPVITLVGDNPQELTVGDAYVELGATATDDTDGDISVSIVTDASAVDTATAGSYSVTYNVSDAAGNAATEVVRTVTVEAATVSGPPCTHTLVMSDEYDDTWNGASVDILVNGTVVASTTGPANGIADDTLTFDAASGDTITLGNWVSGDWDNEISWAILDGAGTSIATGVYEGGADAVTGYCPSCVDPSDLAVSDITTTTASVTWTANNSETSWEYQVVAGGATPAETGDATSDNPLALTGLTSNTTYDVYVRANCGDGVTSGWVMVSFTTECDAITAFPYTEDFDTDWSCWEVINADGDSYTWSQSATYITPRSGSSTAHGMGSNNDYLISPKFTLTGNERVVWYDIVESATYNNTYDVLLSTTGKEISDFTVNLGTYDCTNTSWTEHILNLSAYSGDVYIALHQTYSAATFYGFGVDDFTIMENPSCLDPTDLAVADITTTSASVSWTANNGETAWEYQVVAGGATPAETGDATSDNPLALTGLTENTLYDVYVRANCDADGTSEWVTVSFTTLPAPIVPDYTNDFTTFPGNLWTTDTGVLNTFGGWTADGFANNGTTGAAKINIYTSSSTGPKADDALISPSFDLSGGTYYLNMTAALTPWNGTTDGAFGEGDYISVSVTEDAGATWIELFRWDSSNAPAAAGDAMPELDLSSYASSSVHIKIFAQSGTEVVDNDFFIDDFSITSSSLGIDTMSVSNFTYFPNPVNNVLSIKAQASIDSITVYNMLGQTVVRSTPNTTTTAVDMSGLQTGAYFVQVAINNSIETVRVIKN
jgi:hypothetical protein